MQAADVSPPSTAAIALGEAFKFFDACETGKGWDGCKALCQTGGGTG
eukprot:SAG22_NODE_8117_length_681_cov_1.797251_1_plen_46_part_01